MNNSSCRSGCYSDCPSAPQSGGMHCSSGFPSPSPSSCCNTSSTAASPSLTMCFIIRWGVWWGLGYMWLGSAAWLGLRGEKVKPRTDNPIHRHHASGCVQMLSSCRPMTQTLPLMSSSASGISPGCMKEERMFRRLKTSRMSGWRKVLLR